MKDFLAWKNAESGILAEDMGTLLISIVISK